MRGSSARTSATCARRLHIGQEHLLSGLFAVGKGERVGEVETERLIMNFILVGDVCALPSMASFGSFLLEDAEMALFSSEDIRCLFYLFRAPSSWNNCLGSTRSCPSGVPHRWSGRPRDHSVLPMVFKQREYSAARTQQRRAWVQQGQAPSGSIRRLRRKLRAALLTLLSPS